MKEKLKYLVPVLTTLVLVVASSCRQNEDLAYYYNANSTGGGTGGGCGCCGCCDNDNDSGDISDDPIAPFCEPAAPQTSFCSDGTININAYKGVSFATEDASCSGGQYMGAKDGLMHLAPLPDGRELWNSDNKPLLWIKTGEISASIAEIPEEIESVVVLPTGSVLGYIDGVSSVLGKLIIVQANIGVCGGTESPTATIGHSVLWCEERVCVKKTVSGVTPVKALVKTKINIFDDTYMVLSQAEYGDPKKPEPNLYMTGIKDIAILANGVLAEAKTCMPLISANGTNISISRPPISIGVSHNAELVMDDAVYAEIALVSVLNPEDLESISEGVLPIGIKRPVQVEREYVDINESALKIRIIEPLSGSENVCVDNVLQDTLVLLR